MLNRSVFDSASLDASTCLSQAENEIFEEVKRYNRPVTAQEIVRGSGVSVDAAKRILEFLGRKNLVVQLIGTAGAPAYYALNSQDSSTLENNLDKKYVELAGSLEEKYANIEKENEHLKNQIHQLDDSLNKLYANILTLMGIFVALFSIIVINVSAINSFAEKVVGVKALVFDLIILNIPVIVTIAALLLMIKLFLLPKSVDKKDKSADKKEK